MNAVKLPFEFDSTKMRQELSQFPKTDYSDIYNPSVTLETLWLKHFIEPKGGPHTPVHFYPNEALGKCPYLLSIFKLFKCRVETFRVHSLDPGASIKPHRDSGYSLELGKVRLHIPVQTNDQVDIILDGDAVRMQEGECWYCNFSIIHEVHNRSEQPRIHLILDCIVNEWLEDLFKRTA